jgi:hypothetical protein
MNGGANPNYLGAVLMALGLAASFFIWLWQVASQQAILKLKVETLWAFLFRRGVIEGFQKGWLKENSPMDLTDEANKAMAVIEPDLKIWYKQAGQLLGDMELLQQIEFKFGKRIMLEVCKPNLISNGVCLVAAALVCGRKLEPAEVE